MSKTFPETRRPFIASRCLTCREVATRPEVMEILERSPLPLKKDAPLPKKCLFRVSFLLIAVSWLSLAFVKDVGCADSANPSLGSGIPVNKKILRGIDLLYNHHFEESEVLFHKVIAESPDRPIGYFYLGMVSWSRLASGFWTTERVKEYNTRLDRTIDVARKRVEDRLADSFDFLYLGGALGFKGRFELMRNKWFSSFLLAADAVEALKRCLYEDPDNKDVLLGLGTFDYYTARLSGVLKFLSYLLLHRGGKEEGLRKLQTAANEAIYSGSEAKSMLLHIYLFLEEDFVKALDLAEDLQQRYGRNPRYKFLKGVSQIRLGRDTDFRATVNHLRQKSNKASTVEMSSLWDRRSLYLESTYDLFHTRYSDARSKLRAILRQPDETNDPAMIAWPLLKIGMSYDLEGLRDAAKTYYGRVLDMKNGSGAQFLAKKLLDQPPIRDDPFLGY